MDILDFAQWLQQKGTTVRYYIPSLRTKPGDFNRLICSRWGIENKSVGS
ncbi:MAG: hypothetical protein LBL90_10535 [Prevotellaceae bacterium]|jgi:hypothetical protein|nr:hypothetical protein [Prevotellaceae bacterium]